MLLYQKIVQRLITEIEEKEWSILPGLDQLCRTYHVSIKTMSKAVHELEKKGMVEVHQGRSTFVLNADKKTGCDTGQKMGKSAYVLYESIREKILQGNYQPGNALPKMEYFSITNHVSTRTVYQAFSLLEEENLIHQIGKKRFFGPRRKEFQSRISPNIFLTGNKSPVVIVLLHEYSQLEELFTFNPFMIGFVRELSSSGIQTCAVQIENRNTVQMNLIVTGRGDILSLIQSLGDRYWGTLVVSKASFSSECGEWIKWMTQFKKPVIWYDHGNNPQIFDRRSIRRNEVFRCSIDNRAYIRLSLEALHELGHRKIGLLKLDKKEEANHIWLSRRIDLIRKLAADFNPPFVLVEKEISNSNWITEWLYSRNPDFSKPFEQFHSGDFDNSFRQKAALRKQLELAVPSLAFLLSVPDVTAIVAIDQILAAFIYYWCKCMDVRIPERFSLLAYGNNLWLNYLPVSLIDPKLNTLGYMAAHIIRDDIPVKIDKWGNVVARPEYVDRGSVGMVR